MPRIAYLAGAVLIGLFVIGNAIFVVDERERVLVVQFGDVRQEIEEPGLYFKLPFVQELVRYDARILSLETPTIEVTPSDDRRLLVDAFARYRIDNGTQFREAFPGGRRQAELQLGDIIRSQIRVVLGSEGVTSDVILSNERSALMERVRNLTQLRIQQQGLNIRDVRLRQTDLPEQNLEATFGRMIAERQREAIDERARGREAADRIRAQADRTVVELVSDAEREAEIIRGETDAEQTRILAGAFSADQEFFEFYRGMTALQTSLQDSGSRLVISPQGDFFEYLEFSTGASRPGIDPTTPFTLGGGATGSPSAAEDAAPDAPAEGSAEADGPQPSQ